MKKLLAHSRCGLSLLGARRCPAFAQAPARHPRLPRRPPRAAAAPAAAAAAAAAPAAAAPLPPPPPRRAVANKGDIAWMIVVHRCSSS